MQQCWAFEKTLNLSWTEQEVRITTVCRDSGQTVVRLPVSSVCDHWRNLLLQLPEQHPDSRYTESFFVFKWTDSYTRVFIYFFPLRAANHPELQPLARTDSGTAVGLPYWWKRHSEEESSAAIGHFRSHQSRWDELYYLFSKIIPTKCGYYLAFNLNKLVQFLRLQYNRCVCVCVGEGGHGYLKDWLWWGGLLTSKNLFLVTDLYPTW